MEEMVIAKTEGGRLRQLIDSIGLKHKVFAERVGKDSSTIANYMRNEMITRKTMENLREPLMHFGLNPDFIYNPEAPMKLNGTNGTEEMSKLEELEGRVSTLEGVVAELLVKAE